MDVRLTPEEIAEKQARRLKGSLEDIRRGIDRVTVSPCVKAAEAQDKMLTRLTQAVESGKWARGLKAVTVDQWKARTRDIGVGRIPQGIDAAHDKQVSFYSKLVPHINSGKKSLEGMPSLTLEDSISRMDTFIRHMAKFSK